MRERESVWRKSVRGGQRHRRRRRRRLLFSFCLLCFCVSFVSFRFVFVCFRSSPFIQLPATLSTAPSFPSFPCPFHTRTDAGRATQPGLPGHVAQSHASAPITAIFLPLSLSFLAALLASTLTAFPLPLLLNVVVVVVCVAAVVAVVVSCARSCALS